MILSRNRVWIKNKISAYKSLIIVTSLILLLVNVLIGMFFLNDLVCAFIGLLIVVLLFVYFLISESKNILGSNIFNNLCDCSMGIYIVHHILIIEMNEIKVFSNYMNNNYYLYPILQFFVVLFFCWGFVLFAKKYKIFQYILGG